MFLRFLTYFRGSRLKELDHNLDSKISGGTLIYDLTYTRTHRYIVKII